MFDSSCWIQRPHCGRWACQALGRKDKSRKRGKRLLFVHSVEFIRPYARHIKRVFRTSPLVDLFTSHLLIDRNSGRTDSVSGSSGGGAVAAMATG